MSRLSIYLEDRPRAPERTEEHGARIAALLQEAGIGFAQPGAPRALPPGAPPEVVLEAYREEIDRMMAAYGARSVDAVCVTPDHPERGELRARFLREHIHDEDEVRLLVEGVGQFYIHRAGRVYVVRLEKGDFIRVPARTPHWFDMGEAPRFSIIRLFTEPDGWAARYTDDPIAERFPSLEP